MVDCSLPNKMVGCKFKYHCSLLNFRCHICFEQEVLWHSGYNRVFIHAKCVCDMIKMHSS